MKEKEGALAWESGCGGGGGAGADMVGSWWDARGGGGRRRVVGTSRDSARSSVLK